MLFRSEVAEYRARKRREQRQASSSRQTLDQLLKTREAGEKRLLPLVLKTDVQGSAEAIAGSLAKLGTDGSLVWAKRAGGSSDDAGSSVAALGDGVLVAGGIGVAPLIWLADRFVAEGREVTLVLGGRAVEVK